MTKALLLGEHVPIWQESKHNISLRLQFLNPWLPLEKCLYVKIKMQR